MNPTDNAAPSAAEIAAWREMLAERSSTKRPKWQEPISWMTWAEPLDDRIFAITRRLLAVVEAQAARIGALESENARLRAALEDDDRSVEASIAYLNSTSGGTKNDVTFNRPSEGE